MKNIIEYIKELGFAYVSDNDYELRVAKNESIIIRIKEDVIRAQYLYSDGKKIVVAPIFSGIFDSVESFKVVFSACCPEDRVSMSKVSKMLMPRGAWVMGGGKFKSMDEFKEADEMILVDLSELN